MSTTIQDWNTADIRRFKASFGKQKEKYVEFASDSLALVKQAIAMVTTRADKAFETLVGITSTEGVQGGRTMTAQLNEIHAALRRRTDQALDDAGKLTAKDWAKTIDKSTDTLTQLTDEWRAFEARVISARNLMAANPDDKKLANALLDRAQRLAQTAAELVVAKVGGADEPRDELLKLAVEISNGKGLNFAEIAERLDTYQKRLVALAKAPEPPLTDTQTTYENLMDRLYGVTVEGADGTGKDKIPYQRLFKAFAMVPPEHARNAKLAKVEFGPTKDAGGYYRESGKLIRIQVDMSENSAFTMIDPETGKEERLDAFALTTLHEIGHSLDAAHGLMDANKGKDGGGGWTEMDPFEFLRTGFEKAKTPLREAMTRFFALAVPGATVALPGEKDIEKGYWAYADGKTLDAAFAPCLTEPLREAVGKLQQEFSSVVEPLVDALNEAIRKAVGTAVPPTKVADLWSGLEQRAVTAADAMERDFPGSLTTEAIKRRFLDLYSGAETVPEKPQAADPLTSWIGDQYAQSVLALSMRAMSVEDEVKDWATRAKPVIDPPLDLTPYKAAAKPWGTDLSGAKIAGLAAAHQAYDSNKMWYRYAASARAAKVSDYQFRAPGEWFAELYAITWFKQVEPPKSVANELRAYLFGGSVPIS